MTDINDYLSQTLGDLIRQVKAMTCLSIGVGIFIAAFIASLFLKMLIAKDYRQIAIMKAIGFSVNQLRVQYLTRTLLVLCAGIVWGAILSHTLGQAMVSLLWSLMGAPEIKFIIVPIEVYMLCPLILGSAQNSDYKAR